MKRVADLGQCFALGGAAVVSPVLICLSIRTGNPLIPGAFLIFIALILLMMRIPKSIHERSKISPNRIYTEEGQLVCVAEKYVEYRNIEDVKCVRDFGEFYELVFPFGKISEKFICQKDLLSKGTLAEFEALFGDEILRV